jgi:hypothetical protein
VKKNERKLIVTFYTSADAMALEKKCKEHNIPGRLIPVPRTISSGCGISWRANPNEKEAIINLLSNSGIEYESICEIMY